MKHCKRKKCYLAVMISLVSSTFAYQCNAQTPLATFNEVWHIVNEHFYAKDFNGIDWQQVGAKYKPQITNAKTLEETSRIINRMLGELRASHTHFYTIWDVEYYALLDIFKSGTLGDAIKAMFPGGEIGYVGIGIFTKAIDGKVFIKGVLGGSPADSAGLRTGDRLVSIDGQPFHPIRSFLNKTGRKTKIIVQTAPDEKSVREIVINPVAIRPGEMMLTAMRNSIRNIERDGKKIGYVYVWSYAGQQYHDLLVQEVAFGRLKEADALIIDLRDGWGGANPNYLNLFHKNIPQLTMIDRNGKKVTFDFQWRKPVAMLVNEGTRSGKEILAYGFRKYGIGKVIGTRTAGAVTAGRPFLLAGGQLLYLAVQDVFVDGERLEGVGVAPDIEVQFPIEYAHGRDPQLERALEELSR
ncbi:MAG: S41 family peptidase [bacterium]